MEDLSLPADAEYVRTTPTFTETSVPRGLLSQHQVAAGTWGLLKVITGELVFRFEDADDGVSLGADDTQAIPPLRHHHLELGGPVSFAIEFHRVAG